MSVSRARIRESVARALREDVGTGDLTSKSVIPANRKAIATIVAKNEGVLCGVDVAKEVFRQKGARFLPKVKDGRKLRPGRTVAEIRGKARSILTAERTALNFMQQLSGVSSLTRQFVDLVRGTRAKIYDTRKTTPGLRDLEKYAVTCGGGVNHRMGLYDAILIKENHLALSGFDIGHAVRRARKARPKFIEVEAQSWEDMELTVDLPVDIIMLDNFPIPMLRKAVRFLKKRRPRLHIEASGGVNLQTVKAIARTGVDIISVGALTHSAPALDFSLDIYPA